MSRIIYLLGAGASYGKRNNDVTANSIEHIIEGLPIVTEINTEIDVVLKWLKEITIYNNKLYSFKGYDSERMKDELIAGLEWMKEKSCQHATIDTFAKKLYLNGEMASDYERTETPNQFIAISVPSGIRRNYSVCRLDG